MPLTEIIYGDQRRASIGTPLRTVTLDASVSEQHTKAALVTQHPVEDGADVTDHIRPEPRELSIRGIISNTPIHFLPTLFNDTAIQNDPRDGLRLAEDAYDDLQLMLDTGTLTTIVTSLASYDNMAMSALSVTRDVSTGNVLDVLMTFREIFTAITETRLAREPVDPSDADQQDDGTQGVKDATAQQTESNQNIFEDEGIGVQAIDRARELGIPIPDLLRP